MPTNGAPLSCMALNSLGNTLACGSSGSHNTYPPFLCGANTGAWVAGDAAGAGPGAAMHSSKKICKEEVPSTPRSPTPPPPPAPLPMRVKG